MIDLLKTKTAALVSGVCLLTLAGGGWYAAQYGLFLNPYQKPFLVNLHYPNWKSQDKRYSFDGDKTYGFDGKVCDLSIDAKRGCMLRQVMKPGVQIKLHDHDPTKAVVTVYLTDGISTPDLEQTGVTWAELEKGISFREGNLYYATVKVEPKD